MRIAIGLMALALGVLQYPLWLGERGLPGVWQRQARLEELRATAARFAERNERLEAEVKDLRGGGEAIAERAREDLGMIREDEIFIRMVRPRDSGRAGKRAPGH